MDGDLARTVNRGALQAPFQYFGGKRKVASMIWDRLGKPKQYIEPFFGSGAVLLACPHDVPLEVVGDVNGFLANFWRAVQSDADAVARWSDYPVSHIDLGARHVWLLEQRERLGEALQDPEWPGDHKVAGWWLWGCCAWIGSGWCDWEGKGKAGKLGGQGVQARGRVPHVCQPGRGVQARGRVPSDTGEGMWTPQGDTAIVILRRLARRLGRTRIIHGDWMRTLNHHYGTNGSGVAAVFLDPPYRSFGEVYSQRGTLVADECEAWAREHGHLRVCIAGHIGDYPTLDAAGWECVRWKRSAATMGSTKTRDSEALWFSPACVAPAGSGENEQINMPGGA